MPPCIHNSDAKSSKLSDPLPKERAPKAPHWQMVLGTDTPSCYDSDNNEDEGDNMHYNINTINNLNPKTLRGICQGSRA